VRGQSGTARRLWWAGTAAALLLTATPAALAVTGPGAVTSSATFPVTAEVVTGALATGEGPGLVTPAFAADQPPAGQSGEGVLWLTLAAAGTSWTSVLRTSLVVDVSVDGGTAQQIVLFAGGSPFTYTAFTGPTTTGPHHVTVTVDRKLSPAATAKLTVDTEQVTLGVVALGDPDYLSLAYSPVVYGRNSSASRYTPLLTYVSDTANPDGSHHLEYVYVISAHDQGDSIVPAYQWGLWGRMTDIVTMLDETVAPGGAVTSAAYASCGCENIPDFPDTVEAPEETTANFAGTWFGHHPVLRDATATNYLSDKGTTPFRFQQAPVAAPPSGQLRDAVMDEHPWTYEISDDELPREHVISTDPDNLLVGDYRQYAIVDSDLAIQNAVAVEFEVQLAGDPTWYSTDYRQMTGGVPSEFPFNDGGHDRSAIKLPLDWERRGVTGFRIRLELKPGSTAQASVAVRSLELLEVTPAFQVRQVDLPTVAVYGQFGPLATVLAPVVEGG
jgi:hypothetical protein